MDIPTALVSGQHRKSIGPAIWLYLFIRRHGSPFPVWWLSNRVPTALGISSRVAYAHLDRLQDAGYVTTRMDGDDLLAYVTNKEGQ